MKPKIKVGLLIEVIGLVLKISAVVIFCFGMLTGPDISLIAGAAAGFLAVKQENPISKLAGSRDGAISAAIAGAVILIGQVISALAMLLVDLEKINSGLAFMLVMIGTSALAGMFGIGLVALIGAATDYLNTSNQPSKVNSQ